MFLEEEVSRLACFVRWAFNEKFHGKVIDNWVHETRNHTMLDLKVRVEFLTQDLQVEMEVLECSTEGEPSPGAICVSLARFISEWEYRNASS